MACGCENGFFYNPQTGLCEQVLELPFSHGEPVLIPPICPLEENMQLGTVIFPNITPSQFPLTGQNLPTPTFIDGLSATLTPSATLLSGNLWVGGTTSTGLLNLRGVGLPSTLNTWFGVNRCVTVAQGDVISFAMSAKTAFRLFIDGILAVIHQPTLPTQANTRLFIFPLVLSAGTHTFRAEALSNTSYPCQGSTHYGNFLVEVYRNVTPAILAGINTQAVLNQYYAPTNGSIPLLVVGLSNVFDTSSNNNLANYYCPSGWLNACSTGGAAFSCVVVNTAPFVPCCYTLTDCLTGSQIITNTDLSGYVNHIIKIEEFDGCFIVAPNDDEQCQGSVGQVTVTAEYDDCTTCTQVYYLLTDCNGVATPIITTTDFSGDIGGVVKVEGFDDICWIPTVTEESPLAVGVVREQGYASCEACLFVPPVDPPSPPFYKLTKLAIKTRSVQPGYDTENCDPDFVERVNCNYAEQLYSKLLDQKYGIGSCIIDDYDKWYVKKQLLELNLIYDPDACKVPQCPAPSCIKVTFQQFDPILSTAPTYIVPDIVLVPGPFGPPENPEVQIVYQT